MSSKYRSDKSAEPLSCRVMLVGDEQKVLDGLTRSLSKAYRCESFSDPRLAVKRAQEFGFDVLIVDYHMPLMNGLELIRSIKQYQPAIPAIVLSGYAHLGGVIEAINQGEILCYVTKPCKEGELQELVKVALAKGASRRAKEGEAFSTASARGFDSALQELEATYPGITEGVWDEADRK